MSKFLSIESKIEVLVPTGTLISNTKSTNGLTDSLELYEKKRNFF